MTKICIGCHRPWELPPDSVTVDCESCKGPLLTVAWYNTITSTRRSLELKVSAMEIDKVELATALDELRADVKEQMQLGEHYSNAYFTLLRNLAAIGLDIRLNNGSNADVLPARS